MTEFRDVRITPSTEMQCGHCRHLVSADDFDHTPVFQRYW